MSIRRATISDTLHCATFGHKFIQAADMPAATMEQCLDFCAAALASETVGCFISDMGVILGVVAPLYYRADYLTATELFWWSEDRQGLNLLLAFEEWAVEMGAQRMNMGTLADFTHEKVEGLLMKRGYVLKEKLFAKDLRS